MALPLILGLGISAIAGAFVGAQVDDKLEPSTNPMSDGLKLPSPIKIATYSAIAMGLFWVASKSGTIKAVNKIV